MPEVKFGPATLPRVLCGTSPFVGSPQFGTNAEVWLKRFYDYPERMSELFDHFCRLGYPGAHVTAFPTVIEAALLTKENHDLKIAVSLLPKNWEENLQEALVLDPEVVFVHGAMTDKFLERRLDDLKSCFETIRDASSFPGLATHDTCHTLRALQSEDNPLQDEEFGLLLPINKNGQYAGGTTAEMEEMLSTTDNRHPVMAMKTLAAGRIPPLEALQYVFGIPNIHVVTVGVTEPWQVDEVAKAVDSLHA